MNMNYVILRSNALGGLLLLITSSSLAVSLGPVRGAALVGRTLDLSVLARLDANDDAAALCTEAELAYSDTRIDSGKINIRTSPTGEPGQVLIRVTSSAIVDEPVVSLNLRAGCSAKNSRRYVLLADLPLQAAERPLSAAPAAPTAVPGLSPAPSGSTRGAGSGSESSVSGASRSPNDATAARPAVRAPRRPRPAQPTGEATAGRDNSTSRPAAGASLSQSLRLGESAQRKPGAPRLRLDSAELPAESTPSLKSFSELQSLPSESNPRRSEFAALWRALNLRPDEVARDAQRLDELQAQTRSLRDVNTKNQTELGLAREQLKKAEVERYANPLVYALVALLAALLLGAGYLYYRLKNTRRGTAWWDQRDAEPAEPKAASRRVEPQSLESRFPPAPRPVLVAEPQRNVVRLEENSVPGFRAGDSTFSASGISASPRGVNVNELFDIAQQADFFVSLGQHDHAIEVLSNHIRENVQTSPLAYLDLFKLYHDMDRQREYDELRVEFNRIFNAEVPPFQGFRQRGEGLEAYEGAISRIQSLWNTPRVLDVIEESLFRKPGRPAEAFGLEAYRELLLLYAIANELMDAPREPDFDPTDLPVSPAGGFSHGSGEEPETAESYTELQPLSASAVYGVGADMPMTTPGGLTASRKGRVGLDIDLTDPWLGVDSPDGDETVILPTRKADAFQPASSAWLDFDLSDIGPATNDADAADGIIKSRDKPPRA
jgi:pilus assembly protein FimV